MLPDLSRCAGHHVERAGFGIAVELLVCHQLLTRSSVVRITLGGLRLEAVVSAAIHMLLLEQRKSGWSNGHVS